MPTRRNGPVSSNVRPHSRSFGKLPTLMKIPKLSPVFMSSEEVVQAQLDAYNLRDLDAWLNTYSETAEQFLLHTGELAKGREAI